MQALDTYSTSKKTLKMVCSGFRMGNQLSIGNGTLGTTGFFIGTPGNPPPMGGGGGTVHHREKGVKSAIMMI